MTRHRRQSMLRVLALLVLTAAGYAFGEDWVRGGETAASLLLLHALGAAVTRGAGTSIVVDHSPGGVFTATLTPSCSAWASMLALISLALVIPRVPPPRRLAAALAAAAVVFAGNIARIVGSIAVGLAAGPPSLVLFHNVVGSMFGFAYTLGGFIVVIAVLLPRRGVPLDRPPSGGPYRKGSPGAAAT